MIDRKLLAGVLTGAGLAFSGIYLYKKNKERIDDFLRSQGIDIPSAAEADYSSMELKDLVAAKERLEDIIAEKEFAVNQGEAINEEQDS